MKQPTLEEQRAAVQEMIDSLRRAGVSTTEDKHLVRCLQAVLKRLK